ncbi:DUF6584 family protein [Streptomyces sp. NPDC020807]|uniref:DUF6584 family protein n=1 Tax=Streptomyces sp. NPDC020807 TaxID=3155119 RepID=UPI0033E68E9A
MPLSNTLARVDADLAAGRVPMARQRLRGLVSSFPRDLTLRRRLAEVYRLFGEPAEAGRWMYLEEDRDAAETAAFEARYATVGRRMRALEWSGPEALAATAVAGERLAALRTARAEETGRPVDWDEPLSYEDDDASSEDDEPVKLRDKLSDAGCLLAALLVGGAFVYVWVLGLISLWD